MSSPGRIGTTKNPSRTRKLSVKEFLFCQHLLSDDEVLEYLSGGGSESEGNKNEAKDFDERLMDVWRRHHHDSCDEHFHLRQAFYRRKAEIRKLSANLRDGLGGARIDEDGRLVPNTEPPQPPRADLQPLVDGQNGNMGGNNINGNNNNNNNNNIPNNNNPQFFPGNDLNHHQQEQQEELFLEQKRLETEVCIAHAVRELRMSNQPDRPIREEDFEVVLLDLRGRPSRPRLPTNGTFVPAEENNNNNNNNNDNGNDETTFIINPALRRIAFGCFTMVALIVCIFLKVLPIGAMFSAEESFDKSFDPLLNKVLVIRGWKDHARECSGGLTNRSQSRYDPKWEWLHRIQRSIAYGNATTDCSDGVLHIPSPLVLRSESIASSMGTKKDLREYESGVNLSWFMPCAEHSLLLVEDPSQQQCNNDDTQSDQPASCPKERSLDKCFRGIHDNFIEGEEIDKAIAMGDFLTQNGADHFDVHYNLFFLDRMVPSIVKKTKTLLETTYLNKDAHGGSRTKRNGDIQPVAFRVLTTGPMDGHDVKLKQEQGDKMSMYLSHSTALNEAKYLNWVLKSRRHNDKALYQSYYLPRPYRLEPKRETCDLKFDLQSDSRFCIQTSLFLNTGAGEDYWGGTNLFVDDHPANFGNPSRRIARGLSIDGAKGRLVVSTGGFENLSCRFPTRAGFRTVLQIWWDC